MNEDKMNEKEQDQLIEYMSGYNKVIAKQTDKQISILLEYKKCELTSVKREFDNRFNHRTTKEGMK